MAATLFPAADVPARAPTAAPWQAPEPPVATGAGAAVPRGFYLVTLLLSFALTLSFIQGFRGVLMGRVLDALLPWVGAGLAMLLLAPVFAVFVRPAFLCAKGAAACGAGRILILLCQSEKWDVAGVRLPPNVIYFVGEFLVFAGFCAALVALAGGAGRFVKQGFSRKVYAGSLASGFLFAFAWQMTGRYLGLAWSLEGGIAIGLATVFLGVAFYWCAGGGILARGDEAASACYTAPAFLGSLGAAFMLGVQMMLLLLWVTRPEVMAYHARRPYEYLSLATIGALLLGGFLAYWQMRRKDEFRGAVTCLLPLLNLVPAGVYAFGFFGYVLSPDRPFTGPVIIPAAAVAALITCFNTAHLFRSLAVNGSAWGLFAAGVGLLPGMALALMVWIAPDDRPIFDQLRLVDFDLFCPWFYGAAAALFVPGMLLVIRPFFGAERASPVAGTPLMILPLLLLLAAPLGGLGWKLTESQGRVGRAPPALEPENQRLVFACLYTWYGTPDGPTGARMAAEQKVDLIGSRGQSWTARGEGGVKDVAVAAVPDAEGGGVVARCLTSAAGDGLVLEAPFKTAFLWGPWDNYEASRAPRSGRGQGRGWRTELTLEAELPPGATGRLRFHKGNMVYETPLPAPRPGEMGRYRFLFPDDFTARDAPGDGRVSVVARPGSTGPFEARVRALLARRWAHYGENFHVEWRGNEGVWANDPPRALATERRVCFNPGAPRFDEHLAALEHVPDADKKRLRAAEPYAEEGYYDSLDEAVIRSQLRLMEIAGIDVVLIMHPPNLEVVTTLYRLAGEIGSRLRFAYYGDALTRRDGQGVEHDHAAEFLARFGNHPRTLRVGGRVVYFTNGTGQSDLPYRVYERRYHALRRGSAERVGPDVFLVGDAYAPPCEEWCDLFDGLTYYDTSGIWRARWGHPDLPVRWVDGQTLLPAQGDESMLDRVFGATRALAHSRGAVQCAVVIPGCNNTSVHGYLGTPKEDGRWGTDVPRFAKGGQATSVANPLEPARETRWCYDVTWRAAIDAGADWVLIVSWNELHEGTEIEPTMEHGLMFLDRTRKWCDEFHGGRPKAELQK
ncbi:MAG: hypothetical protein HY719_07630 [Planctomycetes bacterium]|nr:hypothetical protein [Planctomycetota bacterium]